MRWHGDQVFGAHQTHPEAIWRRDNVGHDKPLGPGELVAPMAPIANKEYHWDTFEASALSNSIIRLRRSRAQLWSLNGVLALLSNQALIRAWGALG